MIRAKWIRFDEQTNALDYLEKTYQFIQTVEDQPKNWKWVVLSLHSAIYGFAISACRGTDSSSVLFTNHRSQEQLISFNVAIKRCLDPMWMAPNVDYVQFEFTENQNKSLKKLKDLFRNNFEHFSPKSWSIETYMFPEIVNDGLDIIRLLIVNSDVSWRLKPSKLKKAKSYIFQSKKIINKSKLYLEALELK